ncbi:MAG TPA: hypothetical protein VF690_06825 [Hymenobacter sp.]
MSQIDHLMRHVAEVDGPNLLKLFDAAVAAQRAEQGRNAMAGFWRSWGKRPGTIREMLSHQRPMPTLQMCKVAALVGLNIDEAAALWLANAPAWKIGDLMEVYRAARSAEAAVILMEYL